MSVGTDRANKSTVHIHAKSATVKETDDSTRITVPVSGLAEDRDGDKFTEDGINALVDQLNNESIPMFPNHGLDRETGGFEYRYQDMMGKWVEAEKDGEIVQATAELREDNPDAEELKDLLNQEMPVGFSIGFGWDEADAQERSNGGLEFDDADLMEISPVGIPSHPNAVVQAGAEVASAMKSAGLDPSEDMDSVDITINNMSEQEEESETDDSKDDVQNDMETNVSEIVSVFETAHEQAKSRLAEEYDSFEADGVETEDLEDALKQLTEEEITGVLGGHFRAMFDDIMDAYAATDDEEEFGGAVSNILDAHQEEMLEDLLGEQGEEDSADETEASDDDDDDYDDKVAELRTLVEEQNAQIEELKAELETVKTDSVDSSERKGGMEPAEKEESEETKEPQTPEMFAENII